MVRGGVVNRKLRLAAGLAPFMLVIALLTLFAGQADSAQGAPSIDPNVTAGQQYLATSVVVSGQASAPSGIDDVTVRVQNTATGQWAQNNIGAFGSVPVDLEAWTALLPPLGEPAVSWRVPFTLGVGDYTAIITATDENGVSTTEPAIAFEVVGAASPNATLIEADAEWAYFDQGAEPAAAGGLDWFDVGYNDGAWSTGDAQLGYGDGDEATVTAEFDAQNQKVITTYFRHSFQVTDLEEFDSYTLFLLRDDGAAVYLNGQEIVRSNLPGGALSYATNAVASNEATEEHIVNVGDLVLGENVLAVEIHQVSSSSSDISFAAALTAEGGGVLESDNRPGTYVLTAGDMAQCSFFGDEAVAEQMTELFDADAGVFIGLGDLAYGSGTINEFLNCYDPTIGQFKDVTWPSPGNHEHYTFPNAAGYRQYFGPAAGPDAGPSGGLWYSFDLDEHWHVIALDSDCRGREPLPGGINGDGCAVGSDQEQWLRADLEANQDKNVLAFFHHPPYTNNRYTDHTYTWPLWRALAEYGADITLHGHEHHYERYGQLDYWGERDTTFGIREFIIGTGGTFPRYDERAQEAESDFRGTFPNGVNDFGVLQLWLRPDGYDYKWESILGNAPIDEGTGQLATPMPRASFVGDITDDANGQPIPNARVCVTAARTGVETCADSGSDGAYAVGPIVSDTYNMVVTVPANTHGGASSSGRVLSAPTDRVVDFELDAAAKIAGRVTDAVRNTTISGATVCAIDQADQASTCVESDAQGNYEIANLGAGTYVIEFAATGYRTECWLNSVGCVSPTQVNLAGSDVTGVSATMVADPGGIVGVVTAEENNLPLPGMRVCATGGNLASPVCDLTNASGQYSIQGLLTGTYTVEFSDPSGTRATTCYRDDDTCENRTPIGVLQPQVRTGIDGSLALPLAPTPTPTPTATPTPTVTPTPTPVVIGASSISGQMTVLQTGEAIFAGRVCAVRGFPAAEFCVFTSFDGTYTIPVPPGNYTVFAEDTAQRFLDNCYGTRPCEQAQLVGVPINVAVTGIDIPMDPRFTASQPTPTPTPVIGGDGTIAGTVRSNGAGAVGIAVCATSIFTDQQVCATSDANGRYLITGLGTGNYRVDFDNGAVCYRAKLRCVGATPVGVVSPFDRVGIDADL